MRFRASCACAALAVLVHAFAPARAGVVNPDISVIGQPTATFTTDSSSAARKRAVFDVGETEFMFDAALNPYAHGTFILSVADGQVDVEEAYFNLQRGLPGGLTIKGGKYRVGFGKLNPAHPHSYPFADRFHVLAAYLPGAESFDDTGISLSERIPVPGDVSLTASADVLQGDSFRIPRVSTGNVADPLELPSGTEGPDLTSSPRPAALGRLAAFVPIGDRSGLELGASAVQGTNNVAAAARTNLFGGDAKLKLWTSANAYWLVQGEAMHLSRDDAGFDPLALAYTRTAVRGTGGYLFADFNWATRYDTGASFEHWQQPDADRNTGQAFGIFGGVALLEETTVFRLGWEHEQPPRPAGASADPDAIDRVTLRVLYSMGPHKAHQF